MNNLASYNWLKEYVTTNLSDEDFAREISLRSMSVETIDKLTERWAHHVVGLVNEVAPHPKADRLCIVTVNVGADTVDIVCGGTNVESGQRVCVALPGARVRWHGEGELVTLAETEIRGVKSIGMICAASEVGFEPLEHGDHQIWDLKDITDAPAGTPFAEALGLADTMFDIEITTNRPDAMGIVGLAREAGAATNAKFAWQPPVIESAFANGNALPFSISTDDTSRCARQMAIIIDSVTVAPSPWWLQKRLLMAGIRPINNIVDVTNYVMKEYAQPLHAFDYKALDGNEIRVRAAKPGEKITALNGIEYTLDGELVLADSVKPLDIAGIMGGEHTGTTEVTKTIVLSASSFDATSIRRTSRKLNIQSDAQLLFEKGLSTEALPSALARAVELILKTAGGAVASETFDVRNAAYEPLVFPLRTEKIRERLGVEVSDERIIEILTSLGFTVRHSDSTFVEVPWWRDHDIEGEVDLAEEVARIYGYHEMPSVLPSGTPPTTRESVAVTWERFTKQYLSAAGYDEFFSYSFASEDDLLKYGSTLESAYKILNPLVSDQGYMRVSLVPSVLRAIEANQGHTQTGRFFELSRVYTKREKDIPQESTHLVFGEFGYENAEQVFMHLRGTLETFAAKTGLTLALTRESLDDNWHPTRSATVALNGKPVGTIGEVSAKVQTGFGVDRRVFVAVIDLEQLFADMRLTHRYAPLSEFPSIVRDLSVVLDEKTEFADVAQAIAQDMVTNVALVDVYRGKGIAEGKKSVTLSLTLQAKDRTLTGEEAEVVLNAAGKMLEAQFGGVVR